MYARNYRGINFIIMDHRLYVRYIYICIYIKYKVQNNQMGIFTPSLNLITQFKLNLIDINKLISVNKIYSNVAKVTIFKYIQYLGISIIELRLRETNNILLLQLCVE